MIDLDFSEPTGRSQWRARTVLVPMIAAAFAASLASYAEVDVLVDSWELCDSRGPAGGLVSSVLIPLYIGSLWLVQTILISAAALAVTQLARQRLLVTLYMVLATVLVVTAVAWVFFLLTGLPFQDPYVPSCVEPTPSWLP